MDAPFWTLSSDHVWATDVEDGILGERLRKLLRPRAYIADHSLVGSVEDDRTG